MSWIISLFYVLIFLNLYFFLLSGTFFVLYLIFKHLLIANITSIFLRIIILAEILLLLLGCITVIIYNTTDSVLLEFIPMHFLSGYQRLIIVIICIWFIGVIIKSFIFLRKLLNFRKSIINRNLLVNDANVIDIYEMCKKQLGIKTDTPVYTNDMTISPFVIGCFRPKIIIPESINKERETLTIVFMHELIHLKSKDLLYKLILNVFRIIFWFNPVFKLFSAFHYNIAEYTCDEQTCMMGKGMFTQRSYFRLLYVIQKSNRKLYILTSTFFEDSISIERRIKNMKNFKQPTKKKIILATVLSLLMLLNSSASVFAISNVYTAAYTDWFDSNYSLEETLSPTPILTEYLSVETVPVDAKIINSSPRLSDTITINIAPDSNDVYTSESFTKKAGESVRITLAMSPAESDVAVGLYTPDGKVYVIASGTVDHTFNISKAGNYSIYIENTSSSKVTITGFAYIR